MTKHTTLALAGSSQNLLATFVATSAAAFFKGGRLQHHLGPLEKGPFTHWADGIFQKQKRSIELQALHRLYELTLGITEETGGRKRIWVHDRRLAFYLRT